MRAALYLRISEARNGDTAGIDRQRDDCHTVAARLGWEVVAEYADNDTSAADRTKTRPAWERLLAAADDGKFDAIVAWHDDRLWRDVVQQQLVFGMLADAGVRQVHASRLYDTSSEDDSFLSGIQALVAQRENADKRRRIRRKHEELARAGKQGGGGTRPYGYAEDRTTVVPSEAAVVREAADRVLAGEGTRSVVADLNRRGVPTVTGTVWTAMVLRRVLTAPRTAGLRQLRGEVVGDAEWDGLLGRETWERVVVALDARHNNPRPPRTHVLTGLLRCGRCGAKLSARPKQGGRRQYVCARDHGGCGRLASLAEPLEAEVAAQVLAALDGPALAAAVRRATDQDTKAAELVAELRRVEEARVALAEDEASGMLTRAEWVAKRSVLERREEQARRELERHRDASVLAGLPVGREALQAKWEAAPLSWQRALLDALVAEVRLAPAVRGRNKFDPDRVTVVWKV